MPSALVGVVLFEAGTARNRSIHCILVPQIRQAQKDSLRAGQFPFGNDCDINPQSNFALSSRNNTVRVCRDEKVAL
jgi:hypothetical protein